MSQPTVRESMAGFSQQGLTEVHQAAPALAAVCPTLQSAQNHINIIHYYHPNIYFCAYALDIA